MSPLLSSYITFGLEKKKKKKDSHFCGTRFILGQKKTRVGEIPTCGPGGP